MNHRWLMALSLVVACLTILGASTALAGPSTVAGESSPAKPLLSADDAALARWMGQLDRTHNVVPRGRGFVPGPGVPTQGGYTQLIDNFEQAGKDLDVFRGWVLVQDLSGALYGDYYWGASNCQSSSPDKSAWAIGNGRDGALLDCGAYYPHGVNASALLRLDLSQWDPSVDTLDLVFDFWLNLRTEVESGVVPDGLFVFYHLPTTVGELPFERVVLAKLTGQLPERFWDTPWRVPLNAATDLNDPEREFNLAGMTPVDIEFVMVTKQRDGTTYPEGVFIDNVRLEASVGPGQVTPGTPRPTTPRPTTPPPTTPPPTSETPTSETPTSETPTVETPTAETPTSETPTSETPTVETPTAETPTVETPTVETPTVETPTVETPTPVVGYPVYLPIALNGAPLVAGEPGPTSEPPEATPTLDEPTVAPTDTQETPTIEPSETPEPLEVRFDLSEVDGSGISGEVRMRQVTEGIEVEIELDGIAAGSIHPAHIHLGTCDDAGSVLLPLESVEDGESFTLLAGEMLTDYMNGDHAVRVHLSADDMDTVVACGVIPDVAQP